MKVLTIIGSPRKKGNSYQAAKKLEEHLKHKGDYQFEYLFLKNFNLQDCKGCFNCISRGIEYCPIKDDLYIIQKKIEEADGLVLASPVYVMHISALLKTFIDRQAYLCHRPEFNGKKSMVLCTTAGLGIKETLKYMESVLESWGFEVTAKCGIVTAPWPPKTGLVNKNKAKLQKSADKFDKRMKKRNKKASIRFKNYMSFRIFQNVSENVKEYMPADYQFYKDKKYYYPAHINVITRITTEIILRLVFFLMRDLGPAEKK
jgi:multimeric flavodoxin WrbA